jgi:hypothetical protein
MQDTMYNDDDGDEGRQRYIQKLNLCYIQNHCSVVGSLDRTQRHRHASAVDRNVVRNGKAGDIGVATRYMQATTLGQLCTIVCKLRRAQYQSIAVCNMQTTTTDECSIAPATQVLLLVIHAVVQIVVVRSRMNEWTYENVEAVNSTSLRSRICIAPPNPPALLFRNCNRLMMADDVS